MAKEICKAHHYDYLKKMEGNSMIQGNSRNGSGRCRLSCLLHNIHNIYIPLHTNSWENISRTLLHIVNCPVLKKLGLLLVDLLNFPFLAEARYLAFLALQCGRFIQAYIWYTGCPGCLLYFRYAFDRPFTEIYNAF